MLFFVLVQVGQAANAPSSGFDTTSKHQFGPDGQGSQLRGPQMGSGMVDAYGNPVTIIEKEKTVRLRDSLPPPPKPTRPLPDLPETDAGWGF